MNQTLTITVEFDVKHTPGTHEHLQEIVRRYFEGKGIKLDGTTIRI